MKAKTETRETLSKAQAELLEKMRGDLPLNDGSAHICWWQLRRQLNGRIAGQFNRSTLEALERKGYIKVYRITTGLDYDEVELLDEPETLQLSDETVEIDMREGLRTDELGRGGKVASVEMWYDRQTRNWIVQRFDKAGSQIGEADYCYRKEDAETTRDGYLKAIGGREVVNVVDSGYIAELQTGAWKKQLNELDDGTYEIEVYWVSWLYESERTDHYEAYYCGEVDAQRFYNSLETMAQVKRRMTKDM